ncbi:unnamed protein product, partial [Polarella glacialis]
ALSAATSACQQCGRWANALQLVHESQSLGLRRSLPMSTLAASACRDGGLWCEALELLDGLKLSSLRPDGIVLNAVISACADNQRWEISLLLMQRSREEGQATNSIACSAMLAACQTHGQLGWAPKLLDAAGHLTSRALELSPDSAAHRRAEANTVALAVLGLDLLCEYDCLHASLAAESTRRLLAQVLRRLRNAQEAPASLRGAVTNTWQLDDPILQRQGALDAFSTSKIIADVCTRRGSGRDSGLLRKKGMSIQWQQLSQLLARRGSTAQQKG